MFKCFEGPLRPGRLCELACSNLASWHFANPNMSYYMSASSKLCRSWPVRRAPHSAFEGSLVAGAPSKLECLYTRLSCLLSGKRSRRACRVKTGHMGKKDVTYAERH